MHHYYSSCPFSRSNVSFWLPSDSKRPKHVLHLNSSLETLLYSTFPALSHVYLRTSPGTTNTDVLFSILLHRFSVHPYFASHMLNTEDSRIFGFKAGSVKDGALSRVQKEQCGYPVISPQPENMPQTSDLSRTKIALRKQLVLVSDSHWTFYFTVSHNISINPLL